MNLPTESVFLATVNDCLLELFMKALTRKQTDLVLKNIEDLVQVETMKAHVYYNNVLRKNWQK